MLRSYEILHSVEDNSDAPKSRPATAEDHERARYMRDLGVLGEEVGPWPEVDEDGWTAQDMNRARMALLCRIITVDELDNMDIIDIRKFFDKEKVTGFFRGYEHENIAPPTKRATALRARINKRLNNKKGG